MLLISVAGDQLKNQFIFDAVGCVGHLYGVCPSHIDCLFFSQHFFVGGRRTGEEITINTKYEILST